MIATVAAAPTVAAAVAAAGGADSRINGISGNSNAGAARQLALLPHDMARHDERRKREVHVEAAAGQVHRLLGGDRDRGAIAFVVSVARVARWQQP